MGRQPTQSPQHEKFSRHHLYELCRSQARWTVRTSRSSPSPASASPDSASPASTSPQCVSPRSSSPPAIDQGGPTDHSRAGGGRSQVLHPSGRSEGSRSGGDTLGSRTIHRLRSNQCSFPESPEGSSEQSSGE